MEITFSSENITDLAKTMINVQQTLTPALKDGSNNYTQSTYATLSSVMQVCRDTLITHGIWLTQYPVSVASGHLGLVTKIVHAATGQWQSSLIEMPLPKNDPQGYGSAITYARRYGLSTLIGIITENDDDGEGAMPARQRPQEPKKPKENQARSFPQKQHTEEKKPSQPPQLDGVIYKIQQSNFEPNKILATGNTHAKKDFLKASGFKWDNQNKVWWRFEDAA